MTQYSQRARVAIEEASPLLQPYADPGGGFSCNPSFDGKDRNSVEDGLLRKLDSRMSILIILAFVNYLTRTNIAVARLRGFENDLGLTGTQFSSVLSIFYVGYIALQIPSQEYASKPDKATIGVFIVLRSILGYSFVLHGYHEALLIRFLLGLSEAVFFPGALFFLGRWYKRNELSERVAYLTYGNLISTSFGPLLATGILDAMDGVAGYTAWRWLFLVEGSLTILSGMVAWFILPDFPETTRICWLTPAEHAIARRRMAEDVVDANDSFPVNNVMIQLSLVLKDWKVWYFTVALFFSTLSTSFILYFPTLVATMGYGPTISLLLCSPPWLISACLCLWLGKHSDRNQERCFHIVIPIGISILGFLMAMSTTNIAVRYFSLFLMAQVAATDACSYSWASSTVADFPGKHAVALAFINSISQSGNFVGSYVWMIDWGPSYNNSFAICTITSSVCIVMYLWLRRILRRLNQEIDLEEERRGGGQTLSMKRWRYLV